MRRFYTLLAAVALTTPVGCDIREKVLERKATVERTQPEVNDDQYIDTLLEFYVKGDEALNNLKESGVEVESRKQALDLEGYYINSDIYERLSTPKLPPNMSVTCYYDNNHSIEITADEMRMGVSIVKNVGGLGGVNSYNHQVLTYNEGVNGDYDDLLAWQSLWRLVSIGGKDDKNPLIKNGVGFDDFCRYTMVNVYRQMFNSPAFYCVESIFGDGTLYTSEQNTTKVAQALLFLQDVEDTVCQR